MVDVAQLVEHQIVALVAVGSNPTIHPIKLIEHCISLQSYAILYTLHKEFDRGVAQLVAHSLWERGVVSSSLAAPTIIAGLIIIYASTLVQLYH